MTHTVESLMALAFDAMDAARVWAVKNDDLTLASLGRKREALRAALTEALEQPADCNALMLVKDCLMQANEQVNGPTFMVEPVPQAVPVAWADDNAMQGKVGNVCSTAAKRYWEKSDLVDKKNAELHKHPLYAAPVAVQAVPAVTDEMVNRFLCWKLPRGFYPDGGITFSMKGRYEGFPLPDCWPIGTNLLTADQAREMLEHVIAAAPKGVV